MCCMRFFSSSCWNLVLPCQLAYCRPLSVSISFGTPCAPMPRRNTSSTFSAVWLRNTSSAVMYLEWSSMNPIRYAYPPGPSHSGGRTASPPSLKGKMSLCHIWLGVARSKKRGFDGLPGVFFFAGVMSFSRCSVRRTVSALAGRWKILRRVCAMRRIPNDGCFLLSAAISPRIRARESGLPTATLRLTVR